MSAVLESSVFENPTFPHTTAKGLTIAIAGNPNAGKTSLFNALTGLRQKVANYPGVTVESKVGQWTLAPELPAAKLIDLPGLYSLDATSLDEEIARDALLGRNVAIPTPDVTVIVVDATNLVRNLYLATQLIETGQPIVIALTMFDLAQRSHLNINVDKLSEALGVPVVPVVAKQRKGLDDLAKTVLQNARPSAICDVMSPLADAQPATRQSKLIQRYALIERIVSDAVDAADEGKPNISERIDRFVTHRFLGPIILVVVMLLVFQAIFSWASLPMSLIDTVFTGLGQFAKTHLPAGVFTDLLTDGIIAGVGGVLAFLPQILLLFLFISILEDSGYMARAAFLMDRLMRAVGLHGKAFVPLLSSFACAVPGIMATRSIENPKDRVATILVAPFMSCSARLPVYTLVIAAFFSGKKFLGIISLGAVLILAMYVMGIIVAIVIAWILKHTLLKAPSPPYVMELPPDRLPDPGHVCHALLTRAGLFVKRAGTVILAISILLWALVTFPRTDTKRSVNQESIAAQRVSNAGAPQANETMGQENSSESASASETSEQIQNSFAGRLGRFIEPAIAPLGFDWKMGIGLISS